MRDLEGHTVLLAVPCFNEAQRLDAAYFAALLNGLDGLRLVFVDDGSTDDTLSVLMAICSAHPHMEVLRLERNAGKANAVRVGMLHAWQSTPPPVLTGYLDCDGAFAADDVIRVCISAATARPGGSVPQMHYPRRARGAPGMPRARKMGGSLVRFWLALGTPWPDSLDWQVGFKVYECHPDLRDALARPFQSRWFPDAELLARMGHSPGAVKEPSLNQVDHVPGSSLRLATMPTVALDLLRVKLAQARDLMKR